MSKSKTLVALIVFFAWAALKSAGAIYDTRTVADYGILSAVGLGYLFYVINIPLMLGEAAAAYLLFARKAHAYLVAGVVVTVEAINGIAMSAISIVHLDAAKAFYIASREARGLAVKQGDVDFLISFHGVAVMALVYVAFYVLVYYYLRKVRPELATEAA
jgi:hypothetical protein